MVSLESPIREGLAHFNIDCDESGLKALIVFMEELGRWNRRVNLTGIRDMEQAVRELLYDAFFLKGYVKGDGSILDLGSGAGILAIPLSILHKKTDVFSVDKSLRKIQFQRHIRRVLHLERFTPVHGRAEELAPLDVDYLVAKAFGSIPEIMEKGGRHIVPGGLAMIVKGKKEGPADGGMDGFVLNETIPYELPQVSRAYKLLIYKKVP